MINALLTGIFKLIVGLCSVILSPIDLLITNALPSLDQGLTAVASFFTYIGSSIGWVISLTGLSSETLSLLVLYFTFKLTAPMLFYMIKLALSWYNKLKP